jgi:predicted nucleic acid-binding protein
MSILVDTNVPLRRAQTGHEFHRAAVKTIARLIAAGELVYFTLQNIAEFWSVATRPVVNNGLGLSAASTLAEVNEIEELFTLLEDSSLVYREWKRLVSEHQITGARVYDASLVATMNIRSAADFDLRPGRFLRLRR